MPSAFLTANDLRSGVIVYWTDRGAWSPDPGQALLAEAEANEALLTQILEDPKTEGQVVGPYLVTLGEEQAPKKLRESRRLAGPSPRVLPPQAAA